MKKKREFGIYSRDRYVGMNDRTPKYFDDEGAEINPDLIPKPDQCITCKKDGEPGEQEILCTITRADQQGEEEFICEAYEQKDIDE
jgi:hypothetical protein